MKGLLFKVLLALLAAGGGFLAFTSVGSTHSDTAALGFHLDAQEALKIEDIGQFVQFLENHNVGWVSIEIPWNMVEISPGLFSWKFNTSENAMDVEYLCAQLAKRNIRILAVLSGGPSYLAQGAPGATTDRALLLENWQRFVQTSVDTLGGYVDAWQIGKEINTPAGWGAVLFPDQADAYAYPDAEYYAALLQEASQIIRANDSDGIILLGSLVSNTNDCTTQPNAFLNSLYHAGVWAQFDAISIAMQPNSAPESTAPYQSFDVQTMRCMTTTDIGFSLAEQLVYLGNIVATFGEKPLWVNGISWDAEVIRAAANERFTLGEIVSADYLTRASFELLANAPVENIFWKKPFSISGDKKVALSNDVFLALRNLNQIQLSNSINSVTILDVVDTAMYTWRENGKNYAAVWRTVGGDDAMAVSLPVMAGNSWVAHAIDASSLKWSDGVPLEQDALGNLNLMVSERPVLISGKPTDLGQSAMQIVNDAFARLQENAKDNARSWAEKQKQKALNSIGEWVEEQQQSLFSMLKESFKEWLLKSLGLS